MQRLDLGRRVGAFGRPLEGVVVPEAGLGGGARLQRLLGVLCDGTVAAGVAQLTFSLSGVERSGSLRAGSAV